MDAPKDITIQVRIDTEPFIADINRCVAAAHNAADEIRNAFIGLNPKIVVERLRDAPTYAPGGWTGPQADKPRSDPDSDERDGAVRA